VRPRRDLEAEAEQLGLRTTKRLFAIDKTTGKSVLLDVPKPRGELRDEIDAARQRGRHVV
jgi:hypothetical protein